MVIPMAKEIFMQVVAKQADEVDSEAEWVLRDMDINRIIDHCFHLAEYWIKRQEQYAENLTDNDYE